jgi:ketosteroid isomerase-like protein
MSAEYVELVRSTLESFNQRGEVDLEAIDPAVEWVTLMETHHGHQGVREWEANVTESLDELAIDMHELIDAGDKVIAVATIRGRGRTAGVPAELGFASVFAFRDGKLVGMDSYPDRAAAVAAAGRD